MNICYIFGAGNGFPEKFVTEENDFVIAADAGLVYLRNQKIVPDITVGDFDSLGFIPDEKDVICHPLKKDDTDMMLAIKIGLEKGYKDFVIYGGTGGRPDHTIANLQSLIYIANKGGNGFMQFEGFTAAVVKNGTLKFSTECDGTVSVFAIGGKSYGVNIKGLLYELKNATLSPDFPLGVSNEFKGRQAEITVENGTILVVWQGEINSLRI